MTEIRARLVRCFSATFPDLSPEQIETATPTIVQAWDSLASLTLVAVIEEEFSIQIEPEDIEHLVSFELTLDYISKRLGVLTA